MQNKSVILVGEVCQVTVCIHREEVVVDYGSNAVLSPRRTGFVYREKKRSTLTSY